MIWQIYCDLLVEDIESYLESTESAVRMLIEGVNSYLQILSQPTPVFSAWLGPNKTFSPSQVLEHQKWMQDHEHEIKTSLEAQQRFCDEAFAMACLDGAILQIAYKGIERYSKNESCECVSNEIQERLRNGGKAIKFNIGREVHNIPLGLIVYAGRHQYNHYNENMRSMNEVIFKELAANSATSILGESHEKEETSNPCFSIQRGQNLASNVNAVLKWRSYQLYEKDMRDMMS